MSLSLLSAYGVSALALPTSGVVASGSAGLSTTVPGNLVITQTSQNAVLNWQSFNIGAAESVQFIQPNMSSVALNRVLGADPSRIFGSLSANGKVFIVNPNGVLFGKDSSVNVGGLVASTLDIADSDFLTGRYQFSGTGTGEVNNQGRIQSSDGGYVALLGNRVNNEGVITANQGSVALAAGSAVTLGLSADGLMQVAVDRAATGALASNSGLIQADGGAISLSAQAKDALLASVVNNTGIVRANSLNYRDGRILLDGGDSGVVRVGGEVLASGSAPATSGGTIVATGDKVWIDENARLDATGTHAGGSVLVGGGWQGADPGIRQANAVYVAPTAVLDASARQQGDGGTVVAWSNVRNPLSTTRVYGSLLAQGGEQSGHGGRIETSGRWIDVAGVRSNASSPNGKAGVWLLDPDDLTVSAAATTAVGPPGFFGPGVGASNIQNTDIEAILNTGTPVILDTASGGAGTGNILVSANISKTAGGPAGLGLFAAGAITVGPGVSISSSLGTLDVAFNSLNGVTLGAGSSIASNGGQIVLSGANFTNNAGAAALSAGAGRWIVYSNDPSTNTFGGLVSGNKAIWGQDVGTLAPGAVPAGNRYVFATPGAVLATTSGVISKNYGQTVSVAGAVTYSGTPLSSAATYGNVY
ncbi:MAG: filamentous hemagglutinin, partial [Burkholderiales bacterium PBB4]